MVDIDRALRETGARLRAEQRSPRVDLAAATSAGGRRPKGRTAILVGVVVVLVAGLVALVGDRAQTPTHARVYVVPTTEPTGTSHAPVAQGALVDLVGNAPNIEIDHIGKYSWTSPVVLATPPIEFSAGYHVNGDAQISDFKARPVTVPRGFTVRVSFNVLGFTVLGVRGHPTLKLTMSAQQRPGVVTGFIQPCVGVQQHGSPRPPYAAGNVFALRGVIHLQPVHSGEKEILPTARVGRQHVDQNTPYRFVLPAGRYVIAFNYTRSLEPINGVNIKVLPGATIHENVGGNCK
ncbi:MAG: hypothetical protein ACLPVY_23615 [Acidimicrobiia bacterium]